MQEIPILNAQYGQKIKFLLNYWRNNLSGQSGFVDVNSYLVNYPEGSISAICEFCSVGSLAGFVNQVGFLPENIIKQVIQQVVNSIIIYQNRSKRPFGVLTPSQVMINYNGDMKVNYLCS